MIGLLQGELIKLRTTRTAIGFGLLTLVLAGLSVLAQTLIGDPVTISAKQDAIEVPWPIPVVSILFGVVGASGEHRHGTITSALLIAPGRFGVTTAKLVAYALAGAIGGVLIQLAVLIVGLPLMMGNGGPSLDASDVLQVAARTIAAFAVGSALGVAVGALVRNQVAAVVGTLAYLLILEPIVAAFTDIGDYTVNGLFIALTGTASSGDGVAGGYAGLLLLALTIVVGVLAAFSDRLRDVR